MPSLRLAVGGLATGFATVAVLLAVAFASGPPPAVPPSPAPSATAAPTPSGDPSPAVEPSAPPTAEPAPFGVGAPAPGLSLPQLGGGVVDLEALRGAPVWIQFTATWCPSCRDDASAATTYAARYRETGLVVVGVHVREDETTVARFATRVGGEYPIALDADGATARRWGVLALPMHFFIDRTGIVRAGAVGTVGRDVLASSLMEIMPGTTVVP